MTTPFVIRTDSPPDLREKREIFPPIRHEEYSSTDRSIYRPALAPRRYISARVAVERKINHQSCRAVNLRATYHAVYLRLASLRQVYDVDAVVVEVFHAAVEVLPQKGAGFAGQRDASETQLRWGENRRCGLLSMNGIHVPFCILLYIT